MGILLPDDSARSQTRSNSDKQWVLSRSYKAKLYGKYHICSDILSTRFTLATTLHCCCCHWQFRSEFSAFCWRGTAPTQLHLQARMHPQHTRPQARPPTHTHAVSRTSSRPISSGTPMSISRSKRPKRRSAASMELGRLVAAITITCARLFRPSISVSSWETMRRSTYVCVYVYEYMCSCLHEQTVA